MSDFKALFANYPFSMTEEEIKHEVKHIVEHEYEHVDNLAVCRKLFGHMELTSLHTEDNEDNIGKLVEKVNALDETYPEVPKPAGICVYPSCVEIVKSLLTEDVAISTVVGFPSSQTFVEVKMAETGLALMAGADEIDMVLSVGKFLAGNYEEVCDEIREIKEACKDKKLKVILETGALQTPENIYKAAIVAMAAGCDFIKTATGKDKPTSLNDVLVMCLAIRDFYAKTQTKVGLKVAGGIVTKQDALLYFCVVRHILEEEWQEVDLFRIGTSRLANNLLSELEKEEVHYF